MSDAYENFLEYLNLSDKLIEQSSKDLIAETARALALMVAHYQAKFGEMPIEASLSLLRKEKLDQGDADMLASGLETLIGVLGALREEIPEDNGGPIH